MRKMRKNIVLWIGIMLTIGLLTGCASSDKQKEIIIGDGNFAETKLFAQMAKIIVEENTDLKVTVQDAMADTLAFEELKKGNMDIYMSYDGTLLATFLQLDPSDVPEGQSLYDFANETAQKETNTMLLDKLGFENTYALAVTQETAEKYQLDTISDLKPVAKDLIFATEHQFFDEEGTIRFKPFTTFYGLEFKEGKSIDLGLKYMGIDSGNMDVTMVYGTDGLNKKFNLKILEDDQRFFPEYYGALLVRADLFDDYADTPELKEVLNKLGGQIDMETCIELNYQIDVEEKEPYDVAYEFLKEKGFIEGK